MTPTSQLTGRALDYAVGIAINGVRQPAKPDRDASWYWPPGGVVPSRYTRAVPIFHDDPKWIPALGQFAGKRMALVFDNGIWTATLAGREVTGETLQIAMCRAIVRRELGPEVRVPDEYKDSP